MEKSPMFLSIDEQAISEKSLNQEVATDNLRHLQKHIFQPKCSEFPKYSAEDLHDLESVRKSSNIVEKFSIKDCTLVTTSVRSSLNDSSSCNPWLSDSASLCNPSIKTHRDTATMDSGGKEMSLKGGNVFRQSSVNDEDLFGYGSQNFENQGDPNHGNEHNNENPYIPNFGLLDSSSGSESPKSFKSIEGNKVQNEKKDILEEKRTEITFSDGTDSGFKMRFHEKRSISAVDRREKYRSSSGGEVFDTEIEFNQGEYFPRNSIVQSNSLPDLVTSSNHSQISPPRFNSNPSPRPAVEENLGRQYEFKKILEGQSSMPLSKEKPKIRRSVSIKEEPEILPAENFNVAESEENGNTSSKETDERRRILSSGYGTASSEAGSQDKSELTTSRQTSQLSQGSSGVWTSQETENENVDIGKVAEVSVQEIKEISSKKTQSAATNLSLPNNSDSTEINCISPISFASGGNDSNSTESSIKTVCEDPENVDNTNHNSSGCTVMMSEWQNGTKIHSGDLPCFSQLGTINGNENSSGKFNRLISKEEKSRDRSNYSPSADIKPPESFGAHSHGNLPFILTDESFSLKPSSLDKVKEEDEMNHKFYLQYCTGEASLGTGQPSQSSMQTFSRGSSLTNQQCSPPEHVKRLEDMLLKLGHENLSPSFLENMRDMFSLSPHINNEREKIDEAGSQNLQEFSLDELVRASRCNLQACKERCCVKMHEILRVLNVEIPHLDSSYILVKQYYTALFQHCHSFPCDETKCPILFCAEFPEWESHYQHMKDPLKHFVADVQRYFRNPTMKLFLQTSYKFHKLQSQIQKDEMKEFETHTPMFPLGKFGTHNVCMDNKLQKLVVLTFYPLMEYDHQLSLYTRLKDLNHRHIVSQFWMLEYEDKIQVCSLFCQGGSLEEYLSYVGPLSWQRAFHYMKQILQAVIHLNSMGIVYLNWKSRNMLFPDDRRNIVQVGNFSLSCPVNCQCDIGSVKECLPYNICPPEILERTYRADCRSDIWGAGCLFYEMFAGTPFLHEHRHEKREFIHTKIMEGSLPNIESWNLEIKKILNSCWKIKMGERLSLEKMLKHIRTLKIR